MRIWVTSSNQKWASEVTGLSLEEIARRYAEAREKKIICTIMEVYGDAGQREWATVGSSERTLEFYEDTL